MGVNLKFGQIYTYKIAWLMILAIFQEYKFEFWSNLQYANFDFGKFSTDLGTLTDSNLH